jgi:hypothetical protein
MLAPSPTAMTPFFTSVRASCPLSSFWVADGIATSAGNIPDRGLQRRSGALSRAPWRSRRRGRADLLDFLEQREIDAGLVDHIAAESEQAMTRPPSSVTFSIV